MCFSLIPSGKSLDIMLGWNTENFKQISWKNKRVMTCETCLGDQKLFIEKNDFKVFKDFDTEYKLEHEKCS